MKVKTQKVAYIGLALSIILSLFLSSATLNLFYSYTQPGGSWIGKIHPATYLAIALALIIFLQAPSKALLNAKKYKDEWGRKLFIFLVITSAVTIIKSGMQGMAYLVDTYFLVSLYLLLCTYLSEKQKLKILNIIIAIVIVNSLIALLELLLQTNLIATRHFGFFRSSAFFGHPLNNALISAPIIFIVLGSNWPLILKIITAAIIMISLFAFGARGASGITILCLMVSLLVAGLSQKGSLRRFASMGLLSCAAFLASIGIYYIVFYTGVGTSIASRLSYDNSIQERFNTLSILSSLSFKELFFGMHHQAAFDLIEGSTEISIVENFWIALIIKLGLISVIPITLGIALIFNNLIRKRSIFLMLSVVAFILIASTNNSLATKTPALAIYLLALTCITKNKSSNLESLQSSKAKTQ